MRWTDSDNLQGREAVVVGGEIRARHGAETHSPYCPVGKREREETSDTDE